MRILILIEVWIFIFSKYTESSPTETAKENSEKLVLLKVDIKEPVKRSPVTASNVYGAAPSQFIIRHGDDAQELSPEYLALVQQYTSTQPHAYGTGKHDNGRPVLTYDKLQHQYQRPRLPVGVHQPRPHIAPQHQEQLDSQSESAASHLHSNGLPPQGGYQAAANYGGSNRGTFEQELLQLISANQAHELKYVQDHRKSNASPKQYVQPQYNEQSVANTAHYLNPANALAQPGPDHQQFLIETTIPRYTQQESISYQPGPKPVKHQPSHLQYNSNRQYAPPPPSPPPAHYNHPAAHAVSDQENEAIRQAQLHAEAQALAFQKVSQASHLKHQQAALEQIRIVHEQYRQQSALEQINQGRVSDAGKEHIEEQIRPKDPEAKYRARVKAQVVAEAADARKTQEAAEYKAHADAIIALQRQQQAHLRAQEDAYNYALNFEKNQLKAQEQAQAIANAQAEALYKAHQAARAKAQKEAILAARAQADARKRDPEHTPVIQYLLPNSTPLPESPNAYLVDQQVQKYQHSESSPVVEYVPKSAASVKNIKKKPFKSIILEEIVERNNHVSRPQYVKIAADKAPSSVSDDVHGQYSLIAIPNEVQTPQQPKDVKSGPSRYYGKKNTALDRSGYLIYDSPWLYQNAEEKQ